MTNDELRMTNGGRVGRYVVLRHECPAGSARASHWDVMLEWEGVLRTWAVEKAPDGEGPQAAEALADHRLAYLDYEGPISGERGSVARWDAGKFAVVREAADELVVLLAGERLDGRATITPRSWTFVRS